MRMEMFNPFYGGAAPENNCLRKAASSISLIRCAPPRFAVPSRLPCSLKSFRSSRKCLPNLGSAKPRSWIIVLTQPAPWHNCRSKFLHYRFGQRGQTNRKARVGLSCVQRMSLPFTPPHLPPQTYVPPWKLSGQKKFTCSEYHLLQKKRMHSWLVWRASRNM